MINEKHVIQVFKTYEYKPELIRKEMETMRALKRCFKQSAREVIETSYINKVNKMGWCLNEEQRIINKSQMYSYIKSNNLEEERLMRDLW